MTQRSSRNNTNTALGPYGSFVGNWEPTNVFLEIAAYVNSSAYLAVGIQQSVDASNVNINTSYNYTPTTEVSVFNTAVGLSYYRVVLANEANVQVAFMSLNTLLVAAPNTPVAIDGIITGNVAVTSPLDASGCLLVNDTDVKYVWNDATYPDPPTTKGLVGVKLMGIQAGSETWIQDGGSIPVNLVGVNSVTITQDLSCNILNFPATQAVSGTVSLTDPTSVRIRDSNGDSILTTAGNVMIGISDIYTANPLHTILDSGVVGIDGSANGVTFTDSSTVTVTNITNPLPTGTNILGYVGLDATNSNNTVAISQDGTANGVVVYGSLPAGTAVIGKVILETGSNSVGTFGLDATLNTIKIDPRSEYNAVTINPTATAPSRITGLSNTALPVGGPGLLYGASYQNKSSTVNCWIKLYSKATAPTAADTPFLIQYLEAVQLYTLSHANDNFFNAPITETLWVRATLLPDDGDTTDTGVDAEVTFFVGQ